MSTTQQIIALSGILLALASGFLLSKKGRPLKQGIFTIHKITSIGFIVFICFVIFKQQKQALSFDLCTLTILGTLFFILISILTGAFLSFDKFAKKLIKAIHIICSILIVILTVIIAFKLIS